VNKTQQGAIRIALPFILLGITGLVGWGGHREKIKQHDIQIEKKVDKDVYVADRKADIREHDRFYKKLDDMHSDIKALKK